VKGLSLVQQLSSEIKLEDLYCTRYNHISNIPPSWTWTKITERTPILIIALTGGRPVSGLDVEDQTWGSEGHVTFGQDGLRHLGQPGDVMAEVAVDAGDSVGQVVDEMC